MSDAIVDAEGNALVPREMLDALKARPGDLLRFSVLSTGAVIVRAKNRSITDLAAMLYREGQRAIPIEQMAP